MGEKTADIELVLWSGHHRILHVQETVVGIHRPVTGDTPGHLGLHPCVVDLSGILVQHPGSGRIGQGLYRIVSVDIEHIDPVRHSSVQKLLGKCKFVGP